MFKLIRKKHELVKFHTDKFETASTTNRCHGIYPLPTYTIVAPAQTKVQ